LVLSSQIRRNQAVTHHAPRAGELVDHVAVFTIWSGSRMCISSVRPGTPLIAAISVSAIEEYLFDVVL